MKTNETREDRDARIEAKRNPVRLGRGILINPFDRTVTEVEQRLDDYRQIYVALSTDEHKVDCFTTVEVSPRDTLWVDDEGLLKGETKFFELEGYRQPLAGCGLILGHDGNGESVGTTIPLELVKSKVRFVGTKDGDDVLAQFPPTFQRLDENFQPVGEPEKL
jgi:hypothetical protein